MKITKENYEEVKEELKRYEERTKTLENIIHFRDGILEQVYHKSNTGGYAIVDEHKNKKIAINLSLAYIMVDVLSKYIERTQK